MPQYDAYGKLKRMAFTYNGQTLTLAVNPQNYEFSESQRATTIKTQSDNVIEQYGPDFPIISISGNTGYRKIGGKTGKQRFDDIRKFFLGYMARQVDGAATAGDMYFYNYTDDLSYAVTIPSGGFQYTRNVDTTLLYNWTISLLVLRGSDQPDRSNIVNAITGTGTGSSVKNGETTQAQRSNGKVATVAPKTTTSKKSSSSKNTSKASSSKKKGKPSSFLTGIGLATLALTDPVAVGIYGVARWIRGATK